MASDRLVFDDGILYDFVASFAKLVHGSLAPVFVSLCTGINFFHGDEMNIERVVADRIAVELAKVGVPVNPTTH